MRDCCRILLSSLLCVLVCVSAMFPPLSNNFPVRNEITPLYDFLEILMFTLVYA